jgi:hypothetical protein
MACAARRCDARAAGRLTAMDMPPSRYKVVERGRRLIVVDTVSGMPVTGLDPEQQARIDGLKQRLAAPETRRSTPARDPAPAPSPMAAGDPQVLATQDWFDDKAPRRVRIGKDQQTGFLVVLGVILAAVAAAWFAFGWPAFLVGGFFLWYKDVRRGIRGAITRWLDRMEQV